MRRDLNQFDIFWQKIRKRKEKERTTVILFSAAHKTQHRRINIKLWVLFEHHSSTSNHLPPCRNQSTYQMLFIKGCCHFILLLFTLLSQIGPASTLPSKNDLIVKREAPGRWFYYGITGDELTNVINQINA